MDRFTSMHIFLATVSAGSFSAAAREAGLSPTMVAKHVQSIEDRLGTRLLQRSTRRLALTADGEAYRDRCQQILAEIDELEASIGSDRLAPRGVLRVNAGVAFGVRQVAPLLPAYARLYPAVTVQLGLNNRHVDLVEEGWDVALRIGGLPDSALIARRLALCRMVVCASPDYFAARGTPCAVAELAGHNCLGYAIVSHVPLPWRFQGPDGPTAFEPSGNLQSSEGEALLAAAVAGQGVVMVPTFLATADLAAGRLLPLTLDQEPLGLPLHALWPPGRRLSAKVRSFITFLAEAYGGPQPPWDTPWNAPWNARCNAPWDAQSA